jgi:hypothetical protein
MWETGRGCGNRIGIKPTIAEQMPVAKELRSKLDVSALDEAKSAPWWKTTLSSESNFSFYSG